MATTSIALIVLALAVIAAIAYFALRGRLDAVPVAEADPNEDPAFSASGEAMIVGDVMPLDSNEPVIPAGVAQPGPATRATEATPRTTQATSPRATESASSPSATQPDLSQSDPSTGSGEDCATQRAEIRWSKRFEPQAGAFDDATRLSLIRDLGIVRAPWGVPLLTQAYEEETVPEHRRAALRALAAYRHPDTQPTFELALRADDEESRAIAATALSALRIRAALPS